MGGDEALVGVKLGCAEYRIEPMAKAVAADAHASVPGLEEFTGYAGLGVGIFWSPPLLSPSDMIPTFSKPTHQ